MTLSKSHAEYHPLTAYHTAMTLERVSGRSDRFTMWVVSGLWSARMYPPLAGVGTVVGQSLLDLAESLSDLMREEEDAERLGGDGEESPGAPHDGGAEDAARDDARDQHDRGDDLAR